MVSSTPRPHFTLGKDPVPILQENGWAPGPVWTGGKSRRHRDSIPDRQARSSVAIPTELPGAQRIYIRNVKQVAWSSDSTGSKNSTAVTISCILAKERSRFTKYSGACCRKHGSCILTALHHITVHQQEP